MMQCPWGRFLRINLDQWRLLSNPIKNNEYIKLELSGTWKPPHSQRTKEDSASLSSQFGFSYGNQTSSKGHETDVQYQKLFRIDSGHDSSK